jgi:hypothetical protein
MESVLAAMAAACLESTPVQGALPPQVVQWLSPEEEAEAEATAVVLVTMAVAVASVAHRATPATPARKVESTDVELRAATAVNVRAAAAAATPAPMMEKEAA